MSNMERTSFISENVDLFKGPEGEKLRQALETGDYRIMQAALANNQFLAEQRQQRILEIEEKLLVEEERIGEERNQVYINELKQQKKMLEEVDSLYLVSLETRLKQEQTELDAYKDYLNKQKEALEKSLDKRKESQDILLRARQNKMKVVVHNLEGYYDHPASLETIPAIGGPKL